MPHSQCRYSTTSSPFNSSTPQNAYVPSCLAYTAITFSSIRAAFLASSLTLSRSLIIFFLSHAQLIAHKVSNSSISSPSRNAH